MSNQSLKNQIQLINQSINASINSLNLTKQLIHDLEKLSGATSTSMPGVGRTVNVPGMIGTFDGENMVTEKGEKFFVPQNYASKSGLVYGDTLKRIDENGNFVFKQVQRVKRVRVQGVLVKKEGRWAAVTSEGSYKVLDRTVEHFGLKEGAEIFALIPEGNKNVPFAGLETVRREEVKVEPVKPEIVVEKKKEEPVKSEKSEIKVQPVVVAEKKERPPLMAKKTVVRKAAEKKPEGMSLSEEKPREEDAKKALSDEDLR